MLVLHFRKLPSSSTGQVIWAYEGAHVPADGRVQQEAYLEVVDPNDGERHGSGLDYGSGVWGLAGIFFFFFAGG